MLYMSVHFPGTQGGRTPAEPMTSLDTQDQAASFRAQSETDDKAIVAADGSKNAANAGALVVQLAGVTPVAAPHSLLA